jgi:hypothetical protein
MTKRAIDRWSRLKATGSGDGVIEVPSIDSGIATGFGTARFAVGAQGQPRLLVPIGKAGVPRTLTSTSKLLVTTSSYNVSGKPTTFIDITCLDHTLDVVFAELAEEILRRIKEGDQPFTAVSASISDFRELLKEKTGEDIAESKVLGLVGELHILRLLTNYNPRAAGTWTGPFELRHDFRRDVHAVEVKTSGRSDSTHVSIHGVHQMAAPQGGTLHLVHIRLERVQSGKLSVGSLFNGLIDVGADKEILLRGLEAMGCSDPHGAEWNQQSFAIEGLKVYKVLDGFPRIVCSNFAERNIPEGISALEYRIDLGYANAFEASSEECELAFARIAG